MKLSFVDFKTFEACTIPSSTLLRSAARLFSADAAKILRNEIEVLGIRYATRQEVMDTLELVARGEFKALVTEKAPLEGAEALHQRLDKELIIGRAALVMG